MIVYPPEFLPWVKEKFPEEKRLHTRIENGEDGTVGEIIINIQNFALRNHQETMAANLLWYIWCGARTGKNNIPLYESA